MRKALFALLALAFAGPAFATDPQFGAIRIEATQAVTHAFVSSKTQGSDATKVSANEWNAAHVAPAVLIASVSTGLVWPAQPAAATEFCGAATSYRWRANLTNYSTIRLTAQVVSAGAATAALRLQYTTDTTGAAGWDYLDTVSGPSVTINASGLTVSASVSITAAAKADVLLRLVGINGDGAGGTACYSGIKAATATLADAATTATTATSATSATTATALAGNGANCAAGSFPLGVDASGAVESCTALPTTITGTANQITASAATGGVTLSIPTNPTLPGTTTGTFSGNLTGNVTGSSGSTTGNAGTATALAADGANCSVGSAPLGVDASGAVQGCFAVPSGTGTVSGTNTGDQTTISGNAGTATALAANGANCSAGSYPLGVDASGAAESCTVAFSAAVASGPTYCSSATGSDAYACNLSPAPANYAAIIGVPITILASDVGNTGAATLSLNSIGAQAIVNIGLTTTTPLVTGDVRAGSLVTVQWDGSNFECLSCGGNLASLSNTNTWSSAQTFSSTVQVPDGSAGAPGIRSTASATTGVWFAAGSVNLTVGGGTKFTAAATNTTNTDLTSDATANNRNLGLTGARFAQLWLDATLTTAGTTGAQTINKNLGQVNFAAAATTLVVTDSRATATSMIFLTPQTADATCKSFAATRASGSFTITANAACTAETAVVFLIMAN